MKEFSQEIEELSSSLNDRFLCFLSIVFFPKKVDEKASYVETKLVVVGAETDSP